MPLVDGTTLIHQCLHGYGDGHQLLQSSTRLPAKADQLLLTMSDMSGPSMISGFQSYLTGYAVSGTNWYAFAKTWYASEMRRPGCVWTHTLLIESADLSKIDDLGILLNFFERPERGSKEFTYDSPVVLKFNHPYPKHQTLPSRDFLMVVLRALYETPDAPVYLTASDSSEFSDAIVQVWSQQHSKLRRTFLFSTGSLSNRKFPGRAFDLQIIPQSATRQTQREVAHGIFVESANGNGANKPTWLTYAVDDLLHPGNGRLRSFLKAFGADAREGRKGFSELLGLYVRLCEATEREALCEMIAATAEYYPETSQGSLLKQALLGKSPSAAKFFPTFPESDRLLALATTKDHEAFDAGALKVGERAKNLFLNQRDEGITLVINLLDRDLNPVGEQIIDGIAGVVSPSEVLEFATQKYQLLFVFAKYNPSLLTMPQIWQQSNDRQRELFDIVTPAFKSGVFDIKDLIWSMLEAGSDALAYDITRQYGYDAVSSVIEWFDINQSPLPEDWRLALSYRSEELIKWLRLTVRPSIRTTTLLASLLDPHSASVLALGTEPWLSLCSIETNGIDERALVQTMAFVLALSFHNTDSRAPALAAEAFQIVHDAAASEKLSYGSWRLLMFQAPSHSWWGEWDKCERLRHALVDHFIRFQWSPEFFLKAVPRNQTFKQILRSYKRKSKEGKFFHTVAREVEHGHMSATQAQHDELSFFL